MLREVGALRRIAAFELETLAPVHIGALGRTGNQGVGLMTTAQGEMVAARLQEATRGTRAGPMAGRRVGHTFTKHGAQNTEQLLKQAAGSGRPVGQWLDNAAAERFIAERVGQLRNGARTFDLPKGLGRIVNPDGTFSAATKARLVPSSSGVKTAYPF